MTDKTFSVWYWWQFEFNLKCLFSEYLRDLNQNY